MAVLHDFKCASCGKVFERMSHWNQEFAPCECGSDAVRVFISRREYRAQSFDPVLVYRDSSGHFRFPGRNSGPAPPGYEPVLLRTTAEVRRFEKQMNASERERYMDHKEREEAMYQNFISSRRAELRQQMQHMSPYGRDLALVSMKANDETPSVDYRFEPAFHIEAFSQDIGRRK